MSDQQSNLLSRIGNWFKKAPGEDDAPTHGADAGLSRRNMLHGENGTPSTLIGAIEPRSTFLRPWAKRDAAIENVQNAVGALADLMGSIRDNMERQSARQDELVQYLSHLPQALQQLPESNRVQGETLKAIHTQIEHHAAQQARLSDILDRISKSDEEQSKTLHTVSDHMENLKHHDETIARGLGQVGVAMQDVSKSSEASAQVLHQLRDNLSSRDGELERILHKQSNRFTTLLAVAIFLSIGAVVAVCVFGYMVLDHLK